MDFSVGGLPKKNRLFSIDMWDIKFLYLSLLMAIYEEQKYDLYEIFKKYPPAKEFCAFCYSKKEIDYYLNTSLKDIDTERASVLLWETGDHWESTDVYKHYLPKILEIMIKPYYPSCYTL